MPTPCTATAASLRVATVISTARDAGTHDIVLTVATEDNASYEIRFQAGQVAAVARSLLSIGRSFACDEDGRVPPRVTPIDGAIPGIGPDGQKILDLLLENGAHFPVTFPAHAIPLLQKALETLKDATTGPPPARPAHH